MCLNRRTALDDRRRDRDDLRRARRDLALGARRRAGHVGDRWTLLVIAALLDGPRRFGDLQDEVGGDRAQRAHAAAAPARAQRAGGRAPVLRAPAPVRLRAELRGPRVGGRAPADRGLGRAQCRGRDSAAARARAERRWRRAGGAPPASAPSTTTRTKSSTSPSGAARTRRLRDLSPVAQRPPGEVENARMLRLIGIVISIGLADSLNPTTIAPALYLATGENARNRVAEFTARGVRRLLPGRRGDRGRRRTADPRRCFRTRAITSPTSSRSRSAPR